LALDFGDDGEGSGGVQRADEAPAGGRGGDRFAQRLGGEGGFGLLDDGRDVGQNLVQDWW
jgi:hypothetical protein